MKNKIKVVSVEWSGVPITAAFYREHPFYSDRFFRKDYRIRPADLPRLDYALRNTRGAVRSIVYYGVQNEETSV